MEKLKYTISCDSSDFHKEVKKIEESLERLEGTAKRLDVDLHLNLTTEYKSNKPQKDISYHTKRLADATEGIWKMLKDGRVIFDSPDATTQKVSGVYDYESINTLDQAIAKHPFAKTSFDSYNEYLYWLRKKYSVR